MKILHIAPFNTANVPLTLVRAERALGHESRLITLHRHRFQYEEDICLDLPLLDSRFVGAVKRIFKRIPVQSVFSMVPGGKDMPVYWKPGGIAERAFHRIRDVLWEPYIRKAFREFDLGNFDLYQLDGGLGFLRSAKYIQKLLADGKTVVCCYLGSDLRIRGVIPAIDEICLRNFTVEFDLQQWYPGIIYIPFPFDADSLPEAEWEDSPSVVVGHAPSNRAAKGSDIIIAAVRELAAEYPVSLCLIEGKPYTEAIELKKKCHIFVDQLGPLGYGMNTLEALSMGIPVCSSLAPGFSKMFPDNPIFEITPENITAVLRGLITDDRLRADSAARGREWVREVHDPRKTVQKIHSHIFK